MPLFHRNKQVAGGAPQDLGNWLGVPTFNYFSQAQLPFASHLDAIWSARPVQQAPAVTGVRGEPSRGPMFPANFPSPLSLYNGPRNVFGA